MTYSLTTCVQYKIMNSKIKKTTFNNFGDNE
jgi:hypothetical protein